MNMMNSLRERIGPDIILCGHTFYKGAKILVALGCVVEARPFLSFHCLEGLVGVCKQSGFLWLY